MSAPLLTLIAWVIVAMIVLALLTGKVMAGSRGLQANYYSRAEQPLLYYAFLFIYAVIVFLIFSNA